MAVGRFIALIIIVFIAWKIGVFNSLGAALNNRAGTRTTSTTTGAPTATGGTGGGVSSSGTISCSAVAGNVAGANNCTIIANVTVNGKPARLLVDTGANVSILSPSLGLSTFGTAGVTGAMQAANVTMSVAGGPGFPTAALVLNPGATPPSGSDGNLGIDELLRSCTLCVNGQNYTITPNTGSIAAQNQNRPRILVPVSINGGAQQNFLFDTGAAVSTIFNANSQKVTMSIKGGAAFNTTLGGTNDISIPFSSVAQTKALAPGLLSLGDAIRGLGKFCISAGGLS